MQWPQQVPVHIPSVQPHIKQPQPSYSSVRRREIVSEGVIDVTGKIIIPVKTGQLLIRQKNGTYEIFKARKAKGAFETEYIPTGKFYDAGGALIN